MTNTQIRLLTFELLYSFEIQKISLNEYDEQIKLFLEYKDIKQEKIEKRLTETTIGIKENEDQILNIISQNLKEKWDITRISKVNITLLKLALYEIIYNKLPYKIVVNEAIELAKKYGEKDSTSFINGILANIIKELDISNEE